MVNILKLRKILNERRAKGIIISQVRLDVFFPDEWNAVASAVTQ